MRQNKRDKNAEGRPLYEKLLISKRIVLPFKAQTTGIYTKGD